MTPTIKLYGKIPEPIVSQNITNFPNPTTSIYNSNIRIDLPFVTTQLVSILSGQVGNNYWQVVVINFSLLLVAKLIFWLIGKYIEKIKSPDKSGGS